MGERSMPVVSGIRKGPDGTRYRYTGECDRNPDGWSIPCAEGFDMACRPYCRTHMVELPRINHPDWPSEVMEAPQYISKDPGCPTREGDWIVVMEPGENNFWDRTFRFHRLVAESRHHNFENLADWPKYEGGEAWLIARRDPEEDA
jgi:hypothetical protein